MFSLNYSGSHWHWWRVWIRKKHLCQNFVWIKSIFFRTGFIENTEIEELQTSKHKQQFASDVQMIFQDPFGSLNPVHTVKHHLLRPLKIHHPETNSEILDKEIEKILLDVGLTPLWR